MMEDYVVSDLIIILLPNQTNSEVFNIIDSSLLFSGSDAECKSFCKTYIHNNQIKLKTMLKIERLLDPEKIFSEQIIFCVVLVSEDTETKEFLFSGTEEECKAFIQQKK